MAHTQPLRGQISHVAIVVVVGDRIRSLIWYFLSFSINTELWLFLARKLFFLTHNNTNTNLVVQTRVYKFSCETLDKIHMVSFKDVTHFCSILILRNF